MNLYVTVRIALRALAANTLRSILTMLGIIIGVGAVTKLSAIRWGVAGRIVWAWVITIPMAAAISWTTWEFLHFFG